MTVSQDFLIRVKDKGAAETTAKMTALNHAMGETDRANKGAGQATSNQTKEFAKMSQGLGGLVHIYATVAANVFALTAAFSALKNAAQVTQLFSSMDALSIEVGRNMRTLAVDIRDLTDSAVSMEDAMRIAAQGTTAGFGKDTLGRITTVAKGASKALGRSLPDSIDRLTRGIIKIEPELLDELGIMVRLDDAVKEYSRAIGKSATSLTGYERRQAFANAVLEEGEQKFLDLATAAEANPYDKIGAQIRDGLTEALGGVAKFMAPIFETILQSTTAMIAGSIAIIGTLISKSIPNFEGWANSARKSAEAITEQAQVESARLLKIQTKEDLAKNSSYQAATAAHTAELAKIETATKIHYDKLTQYRMDHANRIKSSSFGDLDPDGKSLPMSEILDTNDSTVVDTLLQSTNEQLKSIVIEKKKLKIQDDISLNTKKTMLKNLNKEQRIFKDMKNQLKAVNAARHEGVVLAERAESIAASTARRFQQHGNLQLAHSGAIHASQAKIIQDAAKLSVSWRGFLQAVKMVRVESKKLALQEEQYRNDLRSSKLKAGEELTGLGLIIDSLRGKFLGLTTITKGALSGLSRGLGAVISIFSKFAIGISIATAAWTTLVNFIGGEDLEEAREATEAMEAATKSLGETFELSTKQVEKYYDMLGKGQTIKAVTQDLGRTNELAEAFNTYLTAAIAKSDNAPLALTITGKLVKATISGIDGAIDLLKNLPSFTELIVGMITTSTGGETAQKYDKVFTEQAKQAREQLVKSLNEQFLGKDSRDVKAALEKLTVSGLMKKLGIAGDGSSIKIVKDDMDLSLKEIQTLWKTFVSGISGVTNVELSRTGKAILGFGESFEEMGKLIENEYLDVVPDTGLYRLTEEFEKLDNVIKDMGVGADTNSLAKVLKIFASSSDATKRSSVEFREASNMLDNWHSKLLEKNVDAPKKLADALAAVSSGAISLKEPGQQELLDSYLKVIEGTEKSVAVNRDLLKASLQLGAQQRKLAEYTERFSKASAEAYTTHALLSKTLVDTQKLQMKSLIAEREAARRQLTRKEDAKNEEEETARILVVRTKINSLNKEMTLLQQNITANKREGVELSEAENRNLKDTLRMLWDGEILSKKILEAAIIKLKVAREEAVLQNGIANAYRAQSTALIALRKKAGGGSSLLGKTAGEVKGETAFALNKLQYTTALKISKLQENALKERNEASRLRKLAVDIESKNLAVEQENIANLAEERAQTKTQLLQQKQIVEARTINIQEHAKLIEAELASTRERNKWLTNFKSYNDFAMATGEQMRINARDELQKLNTDIENTALTFGNAISSGADTFIDQLVAGQNSLETMFEEIGRSMAESIVEDLTKMSKDMLSRSLNNLIYGITEKSPITKRELEASKVDGGTSAYGSARDAQKLGMDEQTLALGKIHETLVMKLEAINNTLLTGRGEGEGAIKRDPNQYDVNKMAEDNAESTRGAADFFKENVGFATGAITLAIGAATENSTVAWLGVIQLFTQAVVSFMSAQAVASASNASADWLGSAAGLAGSYGTGGTYGGEGISLGDSGTAWPEFAKGGIATGPSANLIGEGDRNEAYVPLPDNRSIPVTMTGNSGGTNNINVAVQIDSNGGVDTSADGTGEMAGKQLGGLISAAVQQELIKQQSPGGILAGKRR